MPPLTTKPADAKTSENILREQLIDAARQGWINRLIDLSRRNSLLYYKPAISGTLELPFTPRLSSFLSNGETLSISELLVGNQEKLTAIRSISRKGLENLEEKGLSTLYLALGQCTWTAEDGGRDPMAPILLAPIALKLRGLDLAATEIRMTGEIEVNPVLLHIFNTELNVSIRPEKILALCTSGENERMEETSGDLDLASPVRLEKIIAYLTETASNVPGFRAETFAVIGNFSFQKLAMVKDLENRQADLVASDMIAAIAGDNAARRKLSGSQIETDPHKLDAITPDSEFSVVEADSSQQCAIEGVASGQSAVIHGPPGTGKSQTITNLIATLTARGKKVLFVAEKRAALEVVMARLKKVGLEHLIIDLHGAEQTPKKVMEQVARTLTAVREATMPASQAVHQQFEDRRNKLNLHASKMHKVHAPTQQTIYQMQGTLLRLPPGSGASLRWRGPDLMQLTVTRSRRVLDLLGEAAGFQSLFNRSDPSPWTGVELRDGASAQNAVDLSNRLHSELIPNFTDCLDKVCQSSGLRRPTSLDEVQDLLTLLQSSRRLLDTYLPEVFAEAPDLLISLQVGRSGGVRGSWLRLTNKPYKIAYKRAISLRRGEKTSWSAIFNEVSDAKLLKEEWQALSNPHSVPRVIVETASLEKAYQAVEGDLRALAAICKSTWHASALSEITVRVAALASDSTTPYRMQQLCAIEQELYTSGVQRLIDEIRTTRRPATEWVNMFRHVWLSSTLDAAAVADPTVRGFVGTTHNAYVDDFKRLDATRLQLSADRVRRAHAERTIAAMNKFPEQETLIRGEAARARRHRPLRKIFSEATDVLTAVCPCWMASPLSLCQLISFTGKFDYVIFDEASQVLPEDAIPAILRATHVIVAGDNKQLPPSTFFAAAEEDEESEVDATSYESLLDMMIPFVKGFHLNWHYRSRDESLISFSNHHMYDDKLVTFPGPGGVAGMSHVFVDHIPASEGQEDSSGEEVKKVVELIINHAQRTPARTLGVITMGIKHANRIQALLDREMMRHSKLADFFDTGRPERFFVKNLERVQGDERDVIILSVGYGKDRAGNLPLRFGPILSAGGRRRLNVAATRAKEQIIVVSSFVYSDINSAQVRPGTGLEFLKNYLEYASSGGTLLSKGELTNEPMNDFEADVFDALTARGIGLVPQVGCSKFRIDLAASHPSQPGKFVLAIECDGATYHSSYTARDRDRLRQQQLENLGWSFHRIWSTDWFMRRDEEVNRAVHAFNKAVLASDRPRAPEELIPPVEEQVHTSAPAGRQLRSSKEPPIPRRNSITEYSGSELQALLVWIASDGKLRTNDELGDEMFAALPFARRGAKIDSAIREAVKRWAGGASRFSA